MVSGATHGYGTTLAGATTSTVGEILNITVGDITVDPTEVSNMDSPDAYKEFIAGMLDAGEITFAMNYNKASTAALKTAADSRTSEVWTVTFPDGSTWVATGFVSNLSNASPHDDKISGDCTIKISGKPVFTAAA